jgi:hypothetical protein
MSNDKKHISNFVKNIFEGDFATAKNNLQTAVIEKIKDKMKDEINVQTAASKKGE